MKMRIMSQDKTMSYNFDNINLKIVDTNICIDGEKNIVLGSYGTIERVTEVFTELHRVYIGIPSIQGQMSDDEIRKNINEWCDNVMISIESTPAKVHSSGNFVYMMPLE